jgi:hypothetical protein
MGASVLVLQRNRRATNAHAAGSACSAESRPLGAARCHLCALVSVLEPRTIPGALTLIRDESSPHRQVPRARKDRRTDQHNPLRIRRSRPCISCGHSEDFSMRSTALVSGQDVVDTDPRREPSPDEPSLPKTKGNAAMSAATVESLTKIHWSRRIMSDQKVTSQTIPGTAASR